MTKHAESQGKLPLQVRAALERNKLGEIQALAEQYLEGTGVRKNRRIAFALHEAGARLGDAESAWYAADALEYGEGVEKSPSASARYLRLAVKLGSIGAMTALGEHLWRLGKTDADRREALSLYRRAANRGEPHALHNLGVCYSTGVGVRKNLKTAFEKFSLAAEQGHIEAAFKVGWCLLHGEGTPTNRRLALQWLRRAMKAGHRDAARLLKNETSG